MIHQLIYQFLKFFPKNGFSRLMGTLAEKQLPRPILGAWVKVFIRIFSIKMDDYLVPAEGFSTFNQFFTRHLKPGCRPIAPGAHLMTSPVDGRLGGFGTIHGDTLVQAKGNHYSLAELLGSKTRAEAFEGGHYMTIYLAPYDYHRIHSMVAGEVTNATYLPGELWTVSPWGVEHVPRLFARNERIISYLKQEQGTFALVKVGATVVGKIKLAYHPIESNLADGVRLDISLANPYLVEKGDELGVFEFGSTVIILVPPTPFAWNSDLAEGQHVSLGETIGTFSTATTLDEEQA